MSGAASGLPRPRAEGGAPARVAIVSHSAMAGSELAIARLVEGLDPERFRATVVLPADGPLRESLAARGVELVILPTAWWVPATHWPSSTFTGQLAGLDERTDRLAQWLRAERIALVHTNTVVTLEGALAAARLGIPHLWHSRGLFDTGFPPPYFSDLEFIFGVVDLLADGVICVSRTVREQTDRYCRLAPRHVVHDGFDLAAFLASPAVPRGALLQRLGLDPAVRVVASLGGLQRRKGQLDLVEAFATLAGRYPDLCLVLAGGHNDEEYVLSIVEAVARHGLAGRVSLPGGLSDPVSLLRAAEVVVQPSLSEGFGLGVLEAAAAARPVVATRCGGPEEVLEDGVSGLLVPPADPPALARALDSLLCDPERARRIGEAAARRAASFDVRSTAAAIARIYEATLDARPGTASVVVDVRRRLAPLLMREVLFRAGIPPTGA